jgi:hypothetical protein
VVWCVGAKYGNNNFAEVYGVICQKDVKLTSGTTSHTEKNVN